MTTFDASIDLPTTTIGRLGRQIAAALQTLDSVVSSADPLTVFGAVARLCVPVLCDAATVTLTVGDGTAQSRSWPSSVLRAVGTDPIRVPILSADAGGPDAYAGFLELSGEPAGHDTASVLLAHLLVERASRIVERERADARIVAELDRADNLELALVSNRDIGIAMGVVMANHKLTRDQAFDLLRRLSQHKQRKLRHIAEEVAQSGLVELPDEVPLIAPTPIPTRVRPAAPPAQPAQPADIPARPGPGLVRTTER